MSISIRTTKYIVLLSALIICAGGCVIPLPSKVTQGEQFCPAALAFLNATNHTTRDEVVATLGEPVIELSEPGVMVYVWEITDRDYIMLPECFHEAPHVENGRAQQWGLFIAYDRDKRIFAHETRELDKLNSQEAARVWRRQMKNIQGNSSRVKTNDTPAPAPKISTACP